MEWRRLAIVAAVLTGMAIGLGAFTFVYARGWSYLTTDPQACANCHIMEEHFSAWLKSSHSPAATCNDCHTPHDPIGKWATKARNGFWHSFYFTTGDYPDPLRITETNEEIVGEACRYCHQSVAASMGMAHATAGERNELDCTHCHRYVGHWVR